MFFKKSWFKSFTLIELSVVLFVIAILSTTGIGIYKKMDPKHVSDVKKMKEIQNALDRYFALNKRLPRPADLKVLVTSQDFGKEVDFGVNPGFRRQSSGFLEEYGNVEGFIVAGGVPVQNLGLDNSYAFDSYGNRIEYWTHDLLTRSLGVNYPNICGGEECKYTRITPIFKGNCSGIDYNDQYKYGFKVFPGDLSACEASTNGNVLGIEFEHNNADKTKEVVILNCMVMVDDSFILSGSKGLINQTFLNTAYVLVSHGKDGACSYSRTSTVATPEPPSDGANYQINNCISVRERLFKYSRTTTTHNYGFVNLFHGARTKKFDDIVLYRKFNDLVSDAAAIRNYVTG